jgi:predicted DCC family thiol-disulfide oxidoreductase YuxK
MRYFVIYDGNCNLCTTLVQLLEQLDKGELFEYIPMQNLATDFVTDLTDGLSVENESLPEGKMDISEYLKTLGITSCDCELGMILIDADNPKRRWQGSDAAEEIANLLPAGDVFIKVYRSLPGMKWMGDRFYEQIRDNRYALFGKRSDTYQSAYPANPN